MLAVGKHHCVRPVDTSAGLKKFGVRHSFTRATASVIYEGII